MKKVQEICKKFWKKIYIILPLMLLVFFAYGFVREYSSDTSEKMVAMYNWSKSLILEFSLYSGFACGILYSLAVLYIILLVTLFTSGDEARRNIGFVIVAVSIFVLFIYLYILYNFHIQT